jgi:CRP/FNR family transcriptional regulator
MLDPRVLMRLGKPVRFRAGEKIYRKDTPATLVYFVTAGEVVATNVGADGREAVLYRMGPGYGLAPLTALAVKCYENDCFAETDCQLIAIKTAEVRGHIRTHHEVAIYVLDLALQRLSRRTQQWEDVVLLSAGGRIAKWLLEYVLKHAAQAGEVLTLQTSEYDIGLSLGLSRESVSRHLAALTHYGVIARTGKQLRITNESRLKALANGTEQFTAVYRKPSTNDCTRLASDTANLKALAGPNRSPNSQGSGSAE